MKLSGCLACRDDEAAEPTQREMCSDDIKKHIPKRSSRSVAFELRDAGTGRYVKEHFPHELGLTFG